MESGSTDDQLNIGNYERAFIQYCFFFLNSITYINFKMCGFGTNASFYPTIIMTLHD